MSTHTKLFRACGVGCLISVGLLAGISGNSAMHHWSAWREGEIVSAEKETRKLVLQLHGTNEVLYWTKATMQWDSEENLRQAGKPVTPEQWAQGLRVKVLTIEKNGGLVAERIILQKGSLVKEQGNRAKN
jgi:hypothetical protein